MSGRSTLTRHPSAMCHDLVVGNFRYILFLAVAVSLSVYLYRGYRRWIAPPRDAELGDLDAPSGASGSPVVAPPPAPKPKRSLGFTDPSLVGSASETTVGSESLVEAVIREELAKKRAAESAGSDPTPSPGGADREASATNEGRSGLFAADPASAGRPDRISVAAALTGVRLPDGLVPLVGDSTTADPHLVTFVTATTADGATVGRALGDELERLGYRLRSESDNVAVATKGDAELRVTLHPDAANERLDGNRRFPTVAPQSVVVVFST